jgi:putative protein-disulfide isomerase
MENNKTKLIYFADPMCSWCYGFSPELTKVVERLGDAVEFEIIMGGLRPYNTETIGELGDFLKEHWEQVSERSKQPFSYNILEDTSFIYDTEPSCRAVVLMRQLKPEMAFSFFKKIQAAFYKNNKNTNEIATYLDLLEDFGVDKEAFRKAFESEDLKTKVKEDFEYAANVGVRGFPTLVLQNDNNLYLLSNGYTEAENIMETVLKIKSEVN